MKVKGLNPARVYAGIFYAALALSVVGAIVYFAGIELTALIWLYVGIFVAFVSAVTIDIAYTYYKLNTTVEVEVPEVLPEAEIPVPTAQAEAKRER